MTHIELLELAIEDLQDANGMALSEFSVENLYGNTITALRQAIEQAQQAEPVAWLGFNEQGQCREIYTPAMKKTFPSYPTADLMPVYESPPQRQPLTDEGLVRAAQSCLSPYQYDHFEALLENDPDAHNRLARAIENERGK